MKHFLSIIKKHSTTILLIAIIVLAAFLRLYQLGNVPPSPDWDEVALGYNAYSIMQTGKDEYGKFMPIVLQSFDDYKPALYMYFIMPFILIFDVSLIAVRMPSVVLGILTVLATYFLIKELFDRKNLALLVSFLLAISPWHIQFSRVAFETNAGLSFNVFAALFFIKGLKKPWYLLLAALFMGLNLSIYQSDRAFTPLFAIALIIIFWKKLFALPKKYIVAAVVVGLMTILPLALYMSSNTKALSRLRGVSIFSELTPMKTESQLRYIDDKLTGNKIGILFDNRYVTYSREILSGYLSHFDLNWLFIRGDLSRHHAPYMSILYLWEVPFLLMGIYGLIFFKFPLKTKIFIFTWFLLAPVPAAVTNGVPHAVRTLNFLPTDQVFVAIGLVTAWQYIGKRKLFQFFAVCYLLFAVFNFVYYLNQYFVQQNYFVSEDWQYGYKQAADELKLIQNNYSTIVISDRTPLDQSYMFFLFYLKYPPAVYQQAGNTTAGFREHHKFDKYQFRAIDWATEKKGSDVLFIGRPGDFPPGVNILKTINFLDGKPVIEIVQG